MPELLVGILDGGALPPSTASAAYAGGYVGMVRDLLGPGVRTEVFDMRGPLPDPSACPAWLLTGSPAAAYDPDPWIAALEDFLKAASGRGPIVGVCFGHQLMGQAFGGRVIKSPKGRGLGLHTYDVQRRADWMDGAAPVSLPVVHEDQVVEIGTGCEVIAGSDFTPYGVLHYPERRALSFQSHPEFTPAFARTVVEAHRAEVGDARADEALASLERPADSRRVASWLRAFLRP
jgi:GMP synthase-like glutamine amidotransferase